jgi:hypothetical protein
MEATNTSPQTTPTWTWLAVAICLGAPIVRWGGLELLIAGGSAMACLAVSRQPWPERKQINTAVAIVAICWGAWGGVIALDASSATTQTSSATTDALSDEAYRQKIFAQAMNRVADIEATEQEIRAARADGSDMRLLKSKLKMLQDSHETNQPFTRKFYALSEDQLEEIINEGLAEEWPY